MRHSLLLVPPKECAQVDDLEPICIIWTAVVLYKALGHRNSLFEMVPNISSSGENTFDAAWDSMSSIMVWFRRFPQNSDIHRKRT